MQSYTYKPGLYAINTQIGDKVGYRKETFVGPVRFHLTRIWWNITRKPYKLMKINNSKILYARGTGVLNKL